MAGYKLTATKVERHKPTKKEEVLSDGNGLYIRFRENAGRDYSRTWQYTYKVGTSSKYITLGEHGSRLTTFEILAYRLQEDATLTLGTAREIALELKGLRKKGVDPKKWLESARSQHAAALEAQIKAEKARSNRLTVQQLYDLYYEASLKKRAQPKEPVRMFKKDVLPVLGEMAAADVEQRHVFEVLDRILARGAKRIANLTKVEMHTLFEYGKDRGVVLHNPARIKNSKVGGPNRINRRHLKEHDVGALFKAIPDAKLPYKTQLAIEIAVSTLARVREIETAKWSNLDLDVGEWLIEDTKNEEPHIVYLSPFAIRAFKALKAVKTNDIWVFPNKKGNGPVAKGAFTKQVGMRQRDRPDAKEQRYSTVLTLPGGFWNFHALRKTGSTIMGELNVDPAVIERCLNHKQPTRLEQIYQHQLMVRQQRKAWMRLGKVLEGQRRLARQVRLVA